MSPGEHIGEGERLIWLSSERTNVDLAMFDLRQAELHFQAATCINADRITEATVAAHQAVADSITGEGQ